MNRLEPNPQRDFPLRPRAATLLPLIEAIVLQDGFSRLSVGDLAERLSCSKRTIYEIAPSKNELVLNVLRSFFARIRADADEAAAQRSSPAEGLHDYLQVGVRAAQRLSHDTVTDIQRWEPALQIWQDHVRLRVEGFSALLERGIRIGAFRPVNPVLVAELVFASLNRILQPEFYTATQLSISVAFQETYRLLIPALLANEAQARDSGKSGTNGELGS